MSQNDTTPAEAAANSNRSILRKLVIASLLMFGFGWWSSMRTRAARGVSGLM